MLTGTVAEIWIPFFFRHKSSTRLADINVMVRITSTGRCFLFVHRENPPYFRKIHVGKHSRSNFLARYVISMGFWFFCFILPETNIAPEYQCLKDVGKWNSFWDGLCSGAMFVSGSVSRPFHICVSSFAEFGITDPLGDKKQKIHPGRLTWNIMEPTNHPFRKENDFPNLHHYVPC